MKLLIDEDVPVKIIRFMADLGHDVKRVAPSSSDKANILRANHEARILVTLDKDFSNPLLSASAKNAILLLRIHPPTHEKLIAALKEFLDSVRVKDIKGLIILTKDGHLRI